MLNVLILLIIALSLYLFLQKFSRSAVPILLTALIAIGSMSAVNAVQIARSVGEISAVDFNEEIQLPLSSTGKNVVVLMLDRAMGEFVPYLFHEKPELLEKFDGFTYYSNTISFGGCTNFALPSLVGGYEYTPVELNKRSSEPLVAKHNEALKVMPTLFADNGYQVTVCDPAYANYQIIPDLSIFGEDTRIQAYNTSGIFLDRARKAQTIQNNRRNFFVFGIMKSAPLCLQGVIYNDGSFHQAENSVHTQTVETVSTASGVSFPFLRAFNVLQHLSEISTITEDDRTFLFLSNDTTHEPMLLQEPDYTPSEIVDNTAYDAANTGRFTVDGKKLMMDDVYQMRHYHSNMAAMLQLANWFDYLRENHVYDNTRIIVVSDHGRSLSSLEELVFDNTEDSLERYFPLLLVKDFESHGFTTSEEFMTNADVPALATAGLIENPVNPFTGKAINSSEKAAHEQFIILSEIWDIEENGGNTFLPSRWASVRDNLWDVNNWTFYDEECVLDRHSAP